MPRIDMDIKCPFYKRVYRSFIYCDPIGEEMHHTAACFRNTAERNNYINDFCATHCWQGCAVAQACMERYDEEQGQVR